MAQHCFRLGQGDPTWPPRWPQDAPRWPQNVSKMLQVPSKLLPESQKSVKTHRFSEDFRYFHKLLKMHGNPPKMLPKSSLEASKTSQNTPKRLPRRSMMGPKSAQETPKPFQDAPSSTQDAPKTSPRRPKCLQERPRSPQVAQEPLNTAPSRSAARFLEVSGPPI